MSLRYSDASNDDSLDRTDTRSFVTNLDNIDLLKDFNLTTVNKDTASAAFLSDLSFDHTGSFGLDSALVVHLTPAENHIKRLRDAVKAADQISPDGLMDKFVKLTLSENNLYESIERSNLKNGKEKSNEFLESHLQAINLEKRSCFLDYIAPGATRVILALNLIATGSDDNITEGEKVLKEAFEKFPSLLMSKEVRTSVSDAYRKMEETRRANSLPEWTIFAANKVETKSRTEEIDSSFDKANTTFFEKGAAAALPLFKSTIADADALPQKQIEKERLTLLENRLALEAKIAVRESKHLDCTNEKKELEIVAGKEEQKYKEYALPASLRMNTGLALLSTGEAPLIVQGKRYLAEAATMRPELQFDVDYENARNGAFVAAVRKTSSADAVIGPGAVDLVAPKLNNNDGQPADSDAAHKPAKYEAKYKPLSLAAIDPKYDAKDPEVASYFADDATGPLLTAGLLYLGYRSLRSRLSSRGAVADASATESTVAMVSNTDPLKAAAELLESKHKVTPEIALEAARILEAKAALNRNDIDENKAIKIAKLTAEIAAKEPLLSVSDRIDLATKANQFADLVAKSDTKIDFSKVKSPEQLTEAFWEIAATESQKKGAPADWKAMDSLLDGKWDEATQKRNAQTRALTQLMLAHPDLARLVLTSIPNDGLVGLKKSGCLDPLFKGVAADSGKNALELKPKMDALIDALIADKSILTPEERKTLAASYDRVIKNPATITIACDHVFKLLSLDPTINSREVLNYINGIPKSDPDIAGRILARQGNHSDMIEALSALKDNDASKGSKIDQFIKEYARITILEIEPLKLAQLRTTDLGWLLKNSPQLNPIDAERMKAVLIDHFRSGNKSASEWMEVLKTRRLQPNLAEVFTDISAAIPKSELLKLSEPQLQEFHDLWTNNLANRKSASTPDVLKLMKSICEFSVTAKLPPGLIDDIFKNKREIKNFLKDMPPDSQSRLFVKLMETAKEPHHFEQLLESITPEIVSRFDSNQLKSVKDILEQRLKTFIKPPDTVAKTFERIEFIARKVSGQEIPDALAKSLLESFAPEERARVMEYLKGRAQYCSISGMDHVFADLFKELAPGGAHSRYVKPVSRPGRMCPEINILVQRDGSGAARCYNNLKATGMNHQLYYMEMVGGKPVIADPEGNRYEVKSAEGGRVVGVQIIDGATGQKPTTPQEKEFPRLVLFDKPGTPEWLAKLQGMEKADQLYVPEKLTGSLDGKVKGYSEGINFLDLALAHGQPAQLDALAKQLRKEVFGPTSVAPTEKQAVEQAEVDSLKSSLRTRSTADTHLLALQSFLRRCSSGSDIQTELTLAEAANYRPLTEFVKTARDLHTKIETNLKRAGATMADAIFIVPDCAGSEHLIHELFRRANPGIRPEQFISMSELKTRPDLADKVAVLLDDGFDFGKECLQQKLGKTVDSCRENPHGPKRLIIASLYAFEDAAFRQKSLTDFLMEGKIPGEKKAKARPEVLKSGFKIEFEVGENPKPFSDAVEQKDPKLAGKADVTNPVYGKTSTTAAAAELWPYLRPNNSAKWLDKFAEELGHYSTRVYEPYQLYKPLLWMAPAYLNDIAHRNLPPERAAEILLTHIDSSLEAMEKRRLIGENPTAEELALRAYRDHLADVQKQGPERCAEAISLVTELYSGISIERQIAIASLRKDMHCGYPLWSVRQGTPPNYHFEFKFVNPLELTIADSKIEVKKVECKNGELTLTYVTDGNVVVETVPASGKVDEKHKVATEIAKQLNEFGTYANNNFDRANLITAYLEKLHETGDPTHARTSLALELTSGVIDLELTENVKREYKFELKKPFTFDHKGQRITITGIECSENTEGKVQLKGRCGNAELDGATAKEVRDRLLSEISEFSMSRVGKGISDVKARTLASYLDHLVALEEELPLRTAEKMFGQVSEFEKTFLAEAVKEMTRLNGGLKTFNKENFMVALDTVIGARKANAGTDVEALAKITKVVDSYKTGETSGVCRFETYLIGHGVISPAEVATSPSTASALDYDPFGKIYRPSEVEIRMTPRGPMFVVEGREIDPTKLTKRDLEDLLDEQIRLKRKDIERDGKSARQVDIDALKELEETRTNLAKQHSAPKAIHDSIRARLGRGGAHGLTIGIVLVACLDWQHKLSSD